MKKNFSLLFVFQLFILFTFAQQSILPNWIDAQSNTLKTYSSEVVICKIGNIVYPLIATTSGIHLYLRNAETGTLISSTQSGTWNKPVIVKLLDGEWYIFATEEEGFLSKFDIRQAINNPGLPLPFAVSNGVVQRHDLRRQISLACAVPDKLTASPVVQLKSLSNSAYTLNKDLVMVGTHHGCNSNASNVMYALDAADISPHPGAILWAFNSSGDYQVDYWSDFVLDYNRNAIFCGANLESGRFQNTIWRINTITGNLDWAVNEGAVTSLPILGDTASGGENHLYIASTSFLKAINPETGLKEWEPVMTSLGANYIAKNLTLGKGVEYAKMIYATLRDGKIYAFYDDAASGELQWTAQLSGAVKFITNAVYVQDINKLYAGTDNGIVYEINPANGSWTSYGLYLLNTAPNPIGVISDPVVYKITGSINDLIAYVGGGASGGVIKSRPIPFNQISYINCLPGGWENPANWSSGIVPDANTNVILENAALNCVYTINSHAVCKTLRLRTPSTLNLSISLGNSLTIGQ